MATAGHKSVTNRQRFLTSSSACPICGGYDRMKRGQGERCYGYICDDPEYVYCTNENKAGSLERHDPGYKHKLHGDCDCGIQHNPAIRQAATRKEVKKQHTTDENAYTYDDTRAVAKYHYRDKDGTILYTVVRYEWPDENKTGGYDKTFRQFRWEGSQPIAGLGPLKQRVLYNLPALLKAQKDIPVYWPEGEKDVEVLKQLGLLAVCNVMGAITGTANNYKWNKAYAEALRDRKVILLADNDEAGEEHVKNVAAGLKDIAASVHIVRLPDLPAKGDVSDWLAAGRTREQLEEIANPAPVEPGTFYSEVEAEEIQWLWKNRVPLGKITMLDGLPDQGKSIVSLDLGARVTRGDEMPDGTPGMQGAVIVVAPEDGAGDTIKPRLLAARADVTKVIDLTTIRYRTEQGAIEERPFSIPRDIPLLQEQIVKHHVILVIFDPLMAVLDHGLKAKDDQDVRQAFTPLARMLSQTGCAALVIRHFNKGNSENAILRGAGSIGIIGAARSGLVVVPDPDDETKHVLATPKHNLADEIPKHLLYHIEPDASGRPCIEWLGEKNFTMSDLLTTAAPSASRQEILQILQKAKADNDDPLSPRDIVEASTLSYDQVRKLLSRMLKDGEIVSPSRGKYTASQVSQPSQTSGNGSGSGKKIVTLDQSHLQASQFSSDRHNERHNDESAQEDDSVENCDGCDGCDTTFSSVTTNTQHTTNTTPPRVLSPLPATRPPRPTIDCAFCGPTEWLWSEQEHDYMCPKCFSPFAWTLENNQNSGRFLKALK